MKIWAAVLIVLALLTFQAVQGGKEVIEAKVLPRWSCDGPNAETLKAIGECKNG